MVRKSAAKLEVDRPTPPLDADIDLSGLTYMPMEPDRLLRDARLVRLMANNPAAAGAHVMLLLASWGESPPASFPDDDISFTRAALLDRDVWTKLREEVLPLWELHSDGRRYNAYAVDRAKFAWLERKRARAIRNAQSAGGKIGASRRHQRGSGNESEELDSEGDPSTYSKSDPLSHLQAKAKGRGGRDNETGEKILNLARSQGDRASEFSLRFQTWYTAYPRKDHPRRAYDAWKYAAKREGGGELGERRLFEQCMRRVHLIEYVRPTANQICHPKTYLMRGQYGDELSDMIETCHANGWHVEELSPGQWQANRVSRALPR
jgi:uncharacterized protein YdaU (DUF1376 family)